MNGLTRRVPGMEIGIYEGLCVIMWWSGLAGKSGDGKKRW